MSAAAIQVVGGYSAVNGATVAPTPQSGAPPAADPFASLPAATVGSCLSHPDYTSWGQNGHYEVYPGTYCDGLAVSNGVTAHFNPGMYVISGGGLQFGSGSVTGTGVTFYITGNSFTNNQLVAINNGMSVSLTAPVSGTYKGVLFFQDRTTNPALSSSFSGGASMNLTGSLYFPTTTITFNNGSSSAANVALVARSIDFEGGVGIQLNPAGAPVLPPISVEVSPGTASLHAGQTASFTASVANGCAPGVVWSIPASAPGSINASGIYTAPSTVPSQQTVTVTATSLSDNSTVGTATVTLLPPANPPTVSTVIPATGQQGQMLAAVQITGQLTHFVAGTSSVSFGTSGVTANVVNVADATHLTATVTIAPGATIGATDVMVTTGSEVVTGIGAFTVTAGTPVVSAIIPSSGQQGQVLAGAQITGRFSHFAAGTSTITFGNSGITASGVSVTDPTHLNATISITPGATTGATDVTVTTGSEVATGTGAFTVTAGTPVVSAIIPSSGQQGQVLAGVQITGRFSHFTAGISTISFGNSGITASNVSVTDPTHLNATITIAPGATPGATNVTVTTGSEAAGGSGLFTVIAGTPAISAIAPLSGLQGQVLTGVQITGQFTHFASGSSIVSFGNPGVTVSNISVIDSTHLTATVTIAAAAATGASAVTVTTGPEIASGSGLFTVSLGNPVLSAIAPSVGQQAQFLSGVQITGQFTHFTAGGSSVTFSSTGVTAGNVTVKDATHLTATLTIAATARTGPADVTVTTGAEIASGAALFTVNMGTQVATPTFSPSPGTYSSAQSVIVASTTPTASIRYTTDGTTPSETTGTLYTGPVTVSSTCVLKAVAYAVGYLDSPVATASYTLPISVMVAPTNVTLSAGQSQTFTATVVNTLNQAVTWSSTPPGTGNIDPSTGVYTAPPTVTAPQTVFVNAKSVADNTTTGSATVTLAASFGSGYLHSRTIIIDHTKVSTVDQANFPVLISGTYPFLATVANGGAVTSSSGYDIVFTSDYAGTQQLDHEIESYNPVTGAISMWVRIPVLSHTCDTIIYLDYGNPAIASSQEHKSAVWDSNFAAVVHFANSTGTYSGTLADSTAHGNTLNNFNGAPAAVAGPYNGAASLNGSQWIYRNSPSGFPTGTAPRAVEAWVKSPQPNSEWVSIGSNVANGDRFAQISPSTTQVASEMENDVTIATFPISDGNWHYIVTVLPTGGTKTSNILIYGDGTLLNTSGGSLAVNTIEDMFAIGTIAGAPNNANLRGMVSEVRVSTIDRSADWFATTYHNLSSPSTFYSMLAENSYSVVVCPTTVSLYASQTQQFTATPTNPYSGGVTWSIPPGAAGAVSASGLYTAPPSIATVQTVAVSAASQADSSKTGNASVTVLPPVGVSITPATGTISAGQTLQFAANVQNTSNTAVTWSVTPAGAGAITSTGFYTAPILDSTQQSVTITATSVADPSKSATAGLILLAGSFTPIRVNAGGPAYVDPQGLFWSASNGVTVQGTNNAPERFSFVPPAGNNIPVVYQTGLRCTPTPMQYQATVPNGQYLVTLKFADSPGNAASDTFDVAINGTNVLRQTNVYATAGPYMPWDATFPVSVTNGQITIVLTADNWYAIINAIQIVAASSVEVLPSNLALSAQQSVQFTANVEGVGSQAVTWSISPNVGSISSTGLYQAPSSVPAPITVTVTATSTANPSLVGVTTVSLSSSAASAFVPIRVNAGGPAYTDPQGLLWSASNGFTLQGTNNAPGAYSFTPTAGTNVPVIYQTGLRSNGTPFQYQAVVPNGQYIVTLKFADTADNASSDTFDVTINGVSVLRQLNVYATAGSKTPWDATFPVNVTNGQIAILFTPDTWYAVINAIQILAAGEVQVSPPSATPWVSQTVQFYGSAANLTNPNVTWSVSPAGAGSISATGLYTAPATIPSQLTVTVTATGVASPGLSDSATVNLWPPAGVTVTPQTASVAGGQTLQFSGMPKNGSTMGVTWAIAPSGFGSISSAGLYTAPPGIYTTETVTVIATSIADGSTGTATINLTPAVTVSVAPSAATLGPSEQLQLSASVSGVWNTAVNWNVTPPGMGTISPTGLYAAPSSIAANTTVTITATSAVNPSASGTAILTLSPPSSSITVTMTPTSASLGGGQTQQFAATVSGTGNTNVLWSVAPNIGTISTSGLYTAPAGMSTPQTVTVQAASAASPSNFASANVAISPSVTNSYSYRRAIAVSHAQVPNTDQTNFVVLISDTYSYLANIATGGHVQSTSGYDIVFSSDCAGLQPLSHEIASYNSTTGAVTFRVLLPVVSHTTNTIFYVSYGNSSIATSQENRPAVDAALNSSHPADWLAAAANNQNSPGTFYTIYPENANSVDPSAVTLGASQTQQFAPLFTVSAAGNRANPLVLLGSAQTPSSAQSIAVNGSLAYLCDQNEISVIDVSQPSSPVFVTAALSNYISNSNQMYCAIQQNSLVAFADSGFSNIPGSPAVIAFGLSNPRQPQLIAGTALNRAYFDQPSFIGNTAFLPTGLYQYSIGTLSAAYGDLVSVDLTNLASPAVLGQLLPDGGNGWGPNSGYIYGGTLYNAQLMYVTGSTATDGFGNWNNGTGKLVVASISNPSSMSVLKEVDVPGTVDLYPPVIQGNLAVSLGDTGGVSSGFPSPGVPQYYGNIVVTTFDVTNPQSPAILKLVTTTYTPGLGGGSAQIATNLFLFSGVRDSSGHDVLLLVDTTNPLAPVLTAYPVAAPVTGMVVSGNLLHTSGGAGGYAVYQIPGVTPVQYSLTGSCGGPVTWTITPSTAGSIAASGLYTAPSSVSGNQTVTITATSQADATQTASASINLTQVLSLSVAPSGTGPYVLGNPAVFVATVTAAGNPVSGVTVTFTITGPNARTYTAVTDGSGHATLSYAGAARGTDSIVASSAGFSSGSMSALWVNPASPISTTPVSAEFFTAASCPSGCEAFSTPATQTPAFVQTFPNLMFDPFPGMLASNNTGVTSTTRPFTDIVLDPNGLPSGTLVAQGNGMQAGSGSLAGFSAVFRGSFVVSQAGTYTFNIGSADGFLFGIAGGAARVSGVNVNPPAGGLTVFSQYPAMAANNGPTTGAPTPVVVSFPTPGSYPYEFDYQSGTGGALSFAVTLTQGSTTPGLRSLESLTLSSNAAGPYLTGQPATFTMQATDETGAAIANLPVIVTVAGVNPHTLQAATGANGQATVSYTGTAAGTDLLQVSATFGGLSLSSGQTAATWVASEAPQITVKGNSTLTLPATDLLTATITDPSNGVGGAISVNWTQVSGPGSATFDAPTQTATHVAFPAPGSYVLQIAAADSLGANTLQLTVTVLPPVTTEQGWIASPLDHALITGLVPITVASGTTLTSGTLTYYPASDPTAVTILSSNITGSGAIATFDTTTLPNGTYYLLLDATDNTGKQMSSGIWIVVAGDYKPGRVTTTVTDLSVPAPGLPIQISRTYDSLNRSTIADFGFGWTLGVNMQLETSDTGDITLTLNGQRRTFYFTPQGPSLGLLYNPAYTAEPGFYGALTRSSFS